MNDSSNLEQALDFWLGDWQLTWGQEQHGSNRVSRILGDKVIHEMFDGRPAIPFRGQSWSVYSAVRDLWRQTWVDDSGNYWHFEGGPSAEGFVFATDDVRNGEAIRLRMVFYNIDADSLDWRWERSDDGGETWQLQWQLHYARAVGDRSAVAE